MDAAQVPLSGSMGKKLRWGRIILGTIVFSIIAQVVHTVGAMLEMDYYKMEEYFSVWSKLMMPAGGAPPAEFYYVSIAFTLISAFFVVLFYAIVKDAIPGRGIGRGLLYGFLMFLLIPLSGLFMTVLLINLPLMLVIMWGVEGLIIYLVNGMLIAKLIK